MNFLCGHTVKLYRHIPGKEGGIQVLAGLAPSSQTDGSLMKAPSGPLGWRNPDRKHPICVLSLQPRYEELGENLERLCQKTLPRLIYIVENVWRNHWQYCTAICQPCIGLISWYNTNFFTSIYVVCPKVAWPSAVVTSHADVANFLPWFWQ